MPLRDIALTGVVVGLLPVCFLYPWIGVLVWSWIGYMNPHRLTWGFAYGLPFAMMVAVATLAGLAVTRDRDRLPWTPEVYILLAFWIHMTITTVLAAYPEAAWDQWTKVSKILLMTFVSLILLQRRERLHWLLWVVALSIGFYGVKGGIWALLTGGRHMVLGPPGTFISGNTEIGLALIMVLPIVVYLRRQATLPWLRHLLGATLALSVVAILITHSRGALLGLLVVLALMVFRSQRKVLALGLILVGGWFAMSSLPDHWFGRMETIRAFGEDASATGRLEAWSVAIQMANDNPVIGLGFRAFTREHFAMYGSERARDAHSIYFQVLGEHGWVGFGLYAALLLTTLLRLGRLAGRRPDHPSRAWIPDCARAIQVSLIGYMVAGAFLSMSYFDLVYELVVITTLLTVLARQSIPVPLPAPAPAPGLNPGPRLRRLPARGI